MDVALEVGDVKTTVSVDAAASQVEVRSSTIKETVDRARVVELPLNGRNAADLALLATGVAAFGSNTGDISSSWRPRGTKEFSVNGSRNNNVHFTPGRRHEHGQPDEHQPAVSVSRMPCRNSPLRPAICRSIRATARRAR